MDPLLYMNAYKPHGNNCAILLFRLRRGDYLIAKNLFKEVLQRTVILYNNNCFEIIKSS